MTILSTEVLKSFETIDADGHQVYKTIYRVKSNTPSESPIAVRNASGINGWGTFYEFNGDQNQDAWCAGIDTDYEHYDQDRRDRLVTVTHSTKPGSREKAAGGLQSNPLMERWKVGGSYAQGTKVTGRNRLGKQLKNSAHEPLKFEVLDGYDTLTLEGPSATINLLLRAQAVLRVNSVAIWGLSPRMLLLQQWQYDVRWHGTLSYAWHQLLFAIKYELWNEQSYEMGTREYISTNAVGKRYVPIVAVNDAGYSGKYYLDANGRKLSDVDVAAGNFVLRTDEILPQYDIGTLGFPDPLPGPFV